MSRFGRGRGRGGLPIAAPDGASALTEMPLFPRIENPKRLAPLEAPDEELYRRGQIVRGYLASSAFCPAPRKARTGPARPSEGMLRQRKRPALRASRDFAMRAGFVPSQLLEVLKRPRAKVAKRAPSAELAERGTGEDAILGGEVEDLDDDDEDDDDEEEDENAGADGAKKARRPGGSTADGKKGAQGAEEDEEEGEEEAEEDEDEGDYGENYFDNGEDYDEQESGEDEPVY
mmetsp:Transcript_9423/g.24417  ORF Transcript_9423/g.24417 Transcript_9423/m.24417 type:complete len:232 (-) Transcript_9423:35-730(-)